MKKKIFSLIAVLAVAMTAFATFVIISKDGKLILVSDDKIDIEQHGDSFTIDGVEVSQVTNIYNKKWNDNDDYERAFTQGYLDSKYYTYDRKEQISSQEFKALLKPLIEKYQPDSMQFFNSRISDVDVPLSRSLAAGMAYYVGKCLGFKQNSPYNRSTVENFWDGAWDDMELMDRILPYGQVATGDEENDWMDMINALLWTAERVSVISNKEIIEYDLKANSWNWNYPFMWEDAIRAVTRLYDGIEPEIEYADLNDPRVTNPDPSIITPRLIAKAAKNEIHDIKDLPRQIGFFCGESNSDLVLPYRFGTTAKDIREYAHWGFNSLKYVASWRHLFNNDMQANLNVFKSLDEMVAAAMECGMNLNFCLCAVPGYGMYWADNFREDYIIDADILNPEKRKKTADIWRAIATRYKDVPNANLSFYTIQELQGLYDSTGFGEAQSFTVEQIFDFVDLMVDAIKDVTPERFIFHDAFSVSMPTKDSNYLPYTKLQYKHMSEKYTNTRLACNHMDLAYMFYEYSQGDGNIDWAHHSVWVPTYPITIFGGNGLLASDANNKLIIDGCLPQGTTIDIYLASAVDADMVIAADNSTLYTEAYAGNQDFNPGSAIAWGEQFKKSDKKISVALTNDVKEITVSVNKGALNWCGIEVNLPESYAVDRWRKDSHWDVELGWIAEEDFHYQLYKKKTSTVQIGAPYNTWGSDDTGHHITINDDVTFTSNLIFSYSNKELTEQMVKDGCEIFPKWSCRFEDILVTDMAGALNYWDDTMEIFQRYNIDVWISAIGLLSEENLAPYRICDYEGEDFEGHHNFNVKLLRILQKYLDK